MNCPQCGYENLADSLFCQDCGGKLERVCPKCQADNLPGAKFCRKCGASLAGSVQSAVGSPPSVPPLTTNNLTTNNLPAGGRRHLTVMFCDLVGSTALSGQLDPEELREVVHDYRQACAAVVGRLGGHVAQYLGDGLLVYFGHPLAHEDDPQRAVRAGLEIVKVVAALRSSTAATSRSLQVRVGIHTGLVVLGGAGKDGHEHLAMGEVPNIAARLQAMAAPNAVVLGEATHRLTQGYFVCEDLGPQIIKGRAAPMRVYQALAASDIQSRFDLQVSTGLTPLVGRTEEVGLLLHRWQEVKAGNGQVALLSGEAGIGKSRLLQVLREQLRDEAHVSVECRCSAHHGNSALHPVIEYFHRLLRFEREEPASAKIAKLEQTVSHHRFADGDTLPLMTALLSLPAPDGHALNLTPERQKQKTLATLVAWLLEEAERAPLCFSMEDLHWADPSTLELLKLLIDHAVDARVFILLSHRPEFVPPWGSRSYQSQLTLTRLAPTQVEEMVGRVTGGKPLPAEIVDQIVAKTDGVPLFVEELTKTMLESGWLREADDRYELTGSLPPPAIPATLQDWLMARLDQLAPFREVAQLGAAIGREFSEELIRSVSPLEATALDRALDRLVGAELLYRRGPIGQVRYVFKHALIQDAAYESLLKSRRQQFHERIASALEHNFPEIAATQPELVAHHYTEAGLVEQAIPYWQTAGNRAAAGAAHAEAVKHYSTALDLLARQPAEASRHRRELDLQTALALSLAATRGYAAQEVEQTYNRAFELCQHVGETAELFPVLRGLCTFYIVRDQQPKARQLAEQCLRIAHDAQRVDYLIEGYTPLGYVLFYQGEFRQAGEFLTKGLDLYQAHRGEAFGFVTPQDSGVACLGLLANTQWMLGYPDRALRCAYDALALAQELNQPFNLAYAYNYTTGIHSLRGELDKAIEHARMAFDISSAHGFDVWRVSAMLHLATAEAVFGDREQAVVKLMDGLAAWRACGTELLRPLFLVNLAEICRLVGKFDQAFAAIEEGLAHAEQCGEHEWNSLLHRVRGGLILASSGDRDAAERDFRTAIAIAQRQEAKSFELQAAISLCQLLRKQNRGGEARELLQPLVGWFEEGFETWDLRNAQALLAKLA